MSDALVGRVPGGAARRARRPAGRTEEGAALFVRAERVRDVVVPGLRAKGWRVDEAVAYRTVAGRRRPGRRGPGRAADAVAFTSSSTVERTVELLGVDGVPPVVVSIGPVTSGRCGRPASTWPPRRTCTRSTDWWRPVAATAPRRTADAPDPSGPGSGAVATVP